MKTLALIFFGAGVLLAVRVMFFGVRRSLGDLAFRTQEWPLAAAAALTTVGALLYLEAWHSSHLSPGPIAVVLVLGALAGMGARATVRRSAAAAEASPDPDEDPRFRFQGNIARIIEAMGEPGGEGGRIAFVIDGRSIELAARWLQGTTVRPRDGLVEGEVVIEHVDGDVAWVEPWALVESRL